MPVDYSKYHPDWKDIIRPDILKRDGYKCKVCKVSNRKLFVWENKVRVIIEDSLQHNYYLQLKYKISKIVLTVAHLDHNVDNNQYSNLASLCQLHHLRHDVQQHVLNRKINAAKKGETKA